MLAGAHIVAQRNAKQVLGATPAVRRSRTGGGDPLADRDRAMDVQVATPQVVQRVSAQEVVPQGEHKLTCQEPIANRRPRRERPRGRLGSDFRLPRRLHCRLHGLRLRLHRRLRLRLHRPLGSDCCLTRAYHGCAELGQL